jgi:hypothetical protein
MVKDVMGDIHPLLPLLLLITQLFLPQQLLPWWD